MDDMTTAAPVAAGTRKGPHFRWWVAFLLFLVTVLNYIDRQTLSVLAPVIREEFGMSNQDYSYIIMSFQLAYMIMQTGSGAIFDRIGTRWGFALIFVWWSMSTILHGWARGLKSFIAFRFMLAAGEAGNWPGAAKTIAEWFPPRQRSFAMGIFNTGSSTGALIAPPLIAWITTLYGWEWTFVIIGGGGLFWLFLWLGTYPGTPPPTPRDEPLPGELVEKVREEVAEAPQAPAVPKIPWLHLLRYRQVWGLVLARFLSDPVWWFYVFWLPNYLSNERGLSLLEIGALAWIPFLAADAGCLMGGGLGSYLMRLGWSANKARRTVMITSAFMMSGAVFVVQTESLAVVMGLISLATFAHQSWSTNMLTLPADLFPSNVVASVSGLSGTGAAFGGLLFTFLTGYLVDTVSYAPVFTMAAILHPIAAMVLVFVVGEIKQVDIPVPAESAP